MAITTIPEFAEVCKSLTGDEIFTLFDSEISEDLRNEIFTKFEDLDTYEPTRAAMYMMGVKYNIQSLQDY